MNYYKNVELARKDIENILKSAQNVVVNLSVLVYNIGNKYGFSEIFIKKYLLILEELEYIDIERAGFSIISAKWKEKPVGGN
jgi:hypothetical protein